MHAQRYTNTLRITRKERARPSHSASSMRCALTGGTTCSRWWLLTWMSDHGGWALSVYAKARYERPW
eukprot:2985794-Prorocentrum_lima.AAC.1